MLSCNLYNNYFFNWSAFWSTFQKLTIALTHKHFGGAGRPDSALHLKPFCRNCVWSVLALGIAGSITLGVWISVHKDVCSAMFTFQILLGNDMMDDCSFFFFVHPLLAKGFPGTWDMSLLKKSLNIYKEQKTEGGYTVCHVVSPEPQQFQGVCDLPSILFKSKADCL